MQPFLHRPRRNQFAPFGLPRVRQALLPLLPLLLILLEPLLLLLALKRVLRLLQGSSVAGLCRHQSGMWTRPLG